jgi:hypothetical protein
MHVLAPSVPLPAPSKGRVGLGTYVEGRRRTEKAATSQNARVALATAKTWPRRRSFGLLFKFGQPPPNAAANVANDDPGALNLDRVLAVNERRDRLIKIIRS